MDIIDNITDQRQKWQERLAITEAEEAKKEALQNEFAAFNVSDLRKMKDKELAAWQAKYPADSPQYHFATHEWNNRSIAKHSRLAKFLASVGFIATIMAALLGAWAGTMWQKNPQENPISKTIRQSHKQPAENKALHPIKVNKKLNASPKPKE